MSESTQTNKIQIDQNGFVRDLRDYYAEKIKEAEDKLLDCMQEALDNWSAGKPKWTEEVRRNLRVVERIVAENYVMSLVGLPYTIQDDEFAYLRAMVVAYGVGSNSQYGSGEKVHTKPGQKVLDNELAGRKQSTAKEEYDLPDGFNQVGNNFVEEAVAKMRVMFKDILENATLEIPGSILARNITTKRK